MAQTEGSSLIEQYCGSKFWDDNLTFHASDPDLTPCFQQTVLVWVPCAFLLALSSVEATFLAGSRARHVPWTLLNVAKLMLTCLLSVLCIIDIGFTFSFEAQGYQMNIVDYVTPAIKFVTLVVCCILQYYNKKKGLRTSGVLFIFWFLLALFGAVQFRYEIRNLQNEEPPDPIYPSISYIVFYAITLVMFLLNFLLDAVPKESEYEDMKRPCPEVTSPFPINLLFLWFDKFVWRTYRSSVSEEELWDLKPEESSKSVVPRFEKHWNKAVRKSRDDVLVAKLGSKSGSLDFKQHEAARAATVLPALCRAFGATFLSSSVLMLCNVVVTFVNPQILSNLIAFVSSDDPFWLGIVYAVLMLVFALLQPMFSSHGTVLVMKTAVRARTALISIIYRKALTMSNNAKKESTVGEIVNLMSVDATRVYESVIYLNWAWMCPLQIAVALYFLWQRVGIAALSGLGVMLLLIPLNVYVASKVKTLQVAQMKIKDQRLKMMNEILGGMKVLKLYAWERSFEERVEQKRQEEVRILRHTAYLNAATSFIWTCAPLLVSLLTFTTYVLMDENNELDPQTAFVSVSLFNLIRAPLAIIPIMVANIIQANVSLKRINKYLATEDIDMTSVSHDKQEKVAVSVRAGWFAWGRGQEPVLRGVSVVVPEGSLVAVVGTVGSGKSSLVSAMLGEMDVASGRAWRAPLPAEVAVSVRAGWFAWGRGQEPVLRGVSVVVPEGSLVAVVGTVGSGKSSLVSAMLGEMDVAGGRAWRAPLPAEVAVSVRASWFAWGRGQEPVLRGVSVVVPEGSLVAVVGTVGSGKSSLVSAMLGEMDVASGRAWRAPLPAEVAVSVRAGWFAWGRGQEPVLRGVSVVVPEGSLVAVVGTVGSGKSSLVSAMLGEMDVASGRAWRAPLPAEVAVSVRAGWFAWGRGQEPVLRGVSVVVPEGSLVAVVGTVGSGKSSLVSAMLGEMDVASGRAWRAPLPAEVAVSVRAGWFAWGRGQEPVLRGVSVVVPEGSLVAVVGTVGSGKSSLVSAMLGEMDVAGGRAWRAPLPAEVAVSVRASWFAWGRGEAPVLRGVSVVVPEGSLVAVVGTVGSGKSSLVSAMLGEMDVAGGRAWRAPLPAEVAVSVRASWFAWGRGQEPVLRGVSVVVPEGSLVAVAGTVGSGKSSLVSAMLGEMDVASGRAWRAPLPAEVAVSVRAGWFAWGRGEAPVLRGVSVVVPEGSLVAVVGTVGSGKSSLVSAMLGEMDVASGRAWRAPLPAEVAVSVRAGWFAWGRGEAPVLRGVSVVVPEGSLVAVVGTVGSGKSSLVSAMLGEMDVASGRAWRAPLPAEVAVSVRAGWFAWGRGQEPVLRGVSVVVPEGSLVAVVGTVGSGKSSLVSAMLGEMDVAGGSVNTTGSTAYVPQQAWIQNATLRDNIVFGRPLDHAFYQRVIDACSLRSDLAILPGGDQIEIGEKGINLSGGQKQRVSLARAVYRDSDVYLLDDPLSAVDSHVGKHIFEQVIGPAGLLKNKTRVLVTHGITFLPSVDLVVVLKAGEVSETGTYQQLVQSRGAFSEFLDQHLQDIVASDAPEESLEEVKRQLESTLGKEEAERKLNRAISQVSETRSLVGSTGGTATPFASRSGSVRRRSGGGSVRRRRNSPGAGKQPAVSGQKLIEAERVEQGTVKAAVFTYYVKAMGLALALQTAAYFAAMQVFQSGENVWLSVWSENQLGVVDETTGVTSNPQDMYLGVYGGMGLGQAIFSFLGTLAVSLGALHASAVLHADLLCNVMRLPQSLFDTTPSGRILNRFSSDVNVLDLSFPMLLRMSIPNVFKIVGTIIIISYTTPIFLAVVVPIGVIYYFLQRVYAAAIRQVRRIESASKAPIFSHFEESITGATTIRAYKVQSTFINTSDRRVDTNQRATYPTIICSGWLTLRVEVVGAFVVFFASLFAVLNRGSTNAGLVGLSVSYALQFTSVLTLLVRSASDIESNIVAVERIKEYTKLTQEAPWELPEQSVPSNWPQEGRVEFRNYQLRYREGLDLVLKGINLTINGGEKVGIVGRTGAGKSSLTLALFRIVEPAGGTIYIDGVDVTAIGLHALRSRITIIPQDPVLFSGTLRLNLDPSGDLPEEALWTALEQAHLNESVASLPAGLDFEVSESGENFSVGQRQLICLARALLRKTKVLVLDEATAAVDLETDDLIQATIRVAFKECTVLTIAHRLNTILDSNRVMVLDKGYVIEFEPPEKLLLNTNSVFYGMAKDAGLV